MFCKTIKPFSLEKDSNSNTLMLTGENRIVTNT